MITRKVFLVGCGMGVLASPRTAQAAPNAQAMLAASDAIRNPGQPFKSTVTLNEYEKGALTDSSTLISYSRMLDGTGQFASLVRFVLPARDSGKLMLRNGKDLWFFDPSTKASVRLSPQQRLMGQASNGDVITVNFAKDYEATISAEENVLDGERRNRAALKLSLSAVAENATYSAAELWVDEQSSAPIKARFLADSGRVLKTAYYRKVQNQLGAERPTETVIIDGLNPQLVTLIRLSELSFRNIPVAWFQRDYLPRFQPD